MKQYHNKQHFSHEHILAPLHLDAGEEIKCDGCEELVSDTFYGCLECNFFLHPVCSEAPRSMVHPSHPDHPLTLHQNPTYSSRAYCCDACGSGGKGFSFSCAHCEFDLHILCAALAPTFLFKKEHPHEFKLVCEPERANKLTCYICSVGNQGYWLYYCGACGIGAHVNCLSSKHEEDKGRVNDGGGTKTKKQVSVKGESSSSSSVSVGRKTEAEARRVEEATLEAQRQLLEKRLAQQLMLDAMDNASDYVGPPYTRKYYYY
ncbi:hypothetical protein ABFS82_02G127900 [Erythranthe guttata]|uniref:DC1 domain-containing protein n=1 Tax=Erythranthe guttata TaxID=4155 RepID=A0A022QHT0_ERYGU|nr:PREDICTED: uncharacterized protein LOC105969433 [Erythranthe guttata]EYU27149.1 hypothetical protein MIMGU_mgv1a012140mg [Erythranthe guttata]|eukprot:XP_012849642.1 PREDICTED: uncharacterized protein LOC105969433 [Erythranthe guttata]